jgi:hypothetical protein
MWLFWPTVYKTGAAATGRIVATQFCPFQIVTVTVFLPWSRFSSATTTYTNGMEWCLRVGHHQLWSSWLLIYHNCLYQLNIYLLSRFVDRSSESKGLIWLHYISRIHNPGLQRQSWSLTICAYVLCKHCTLPHLLDILMFSNMKEVWLEINSFYIANLF